jgi:hypothetical protein
VKDPTASMGIENIKFDYTFIAIEGIVDVQISKNNPFLITLSFN